MARIRASEYLSNLARPREERIREGYIVSCRGRYADVRMGGSAQIARNVPLASHIPEAESLAGVGCTIAYYNGQPTINALLISKYSTNAATIYVSGSAGSGSVSDAFAAHVANEDAHHGAFAGLSADGSLVYPEEPNDTIDITGQTGILSVVGTNAILISPDYGLADPTNIDLSAATPGTTDTLARSDHQHLLDQSMLPEWTGLHTFKGISGQIALSYGGANEATIGVDGVGDLNLASADDIVLAPTGNVRAPDILSPDFVSRLIGWGIDSDGVGDFRTLYADEMHIRLFTTDISRALAGEQIVTKSASTVAVEFTVPAILNDSVNAHIERIPGVNLALFTVDDYVKVRCFENTGGILDVYDVWFKVIGSELSSSENWDEDLTNWGDEGEAWLEEYTDTYELEVVYAGAGDEGLGKTIYKATPILDYGQTGDGWWQVTTIEDNSPYTQIATWATNPWAAGNTTLHLRIGNLDGILGGSDEWGILAGDYSGGQYITAGNMGVNVYNADLVVTSGTNEVIKLDHLLGLKVSSGAWAEDTSVFGAFVANDTEILDIDAGDVVIGKFFGTAAKGLHWDHSADALVLRGSMMVSGAGDITPSTAGLYLTAGKMGYWNGTAWKAYFDNSGNFNLGTKLTWDGANLTITGTAYITGTMSGSVTGIASLRGGFPASPGGIAGLYLGSDMLGFYNGTAWTAALDSEGNFNLGNKLTWDGSELIIEGEIKASVITALSNLTCGTNNALVRLSATHGTYRLWVGHETAASAPFRVSNAGVLTCTGASVTGNIYAAGGTITGALQITGSGGFWQGTGSFAAPGTGIKIAQSAGVGYIQGFKSSDVVFEIDTDGKVSFTGGYDGASACVKFGDSGLIIQPDGVDDAVRAYKFSRAENWTTFIGGLYCKDTGVVDVSLNAKRYTTGGARVFVEAADSDGSDRRGIICSRQFDSKDYVQVHGAGLHVGDTPSDRDVGDIYAENDITAGDSIAAGNNVTAVNNIGAGGVFNCDGKAGKGDGADFIVTYVDEAYDAHTLYFRGGILWKQA